MSPSNQPEANIYKRVNFQAGLANCSVWGPYKEVLIPGYWMAEGGQSATGSLLHHIIATHAAYAAANKTALEKGISIFEYLNDHLDTMRSQANSPTLSYLTRYFYCKTLFGSFNQKYIPILWEIDLH